MTQRATCRAVLVLTAVLATGASGQEAAVPASGAEAAAPLPEREIAPASGREAAAPAPETQRLLEWLRAKADERTPRFAANSAWEDLGDEAAAAHAALIAADLAELRATFDPTALDVEGLVELRVFEHQAEQLLRDHALRERSFVFPSTTGPAPHESVAGIIRFGIYRPPDGPAPDAEAGERYVARIEAADGYLDQARAELEERAARGVVPPKRILRELIAQCEQILTGAPFEAGPPSTLLAAVSRSIDGLDASDAEKGALLDRATAALVDDLEAAYRRLIASFERLETEAPDSFGQWPAGEAGAVYDHIVATQTSMPLTAEEARAIGERELARLLGEIETAAANAGFDGSVAALFDFLRTDDRFYYPNTDAGRAAYLAEATRVIERMRARLDEVVADPPEVPLEVVRFSPEQESQAVSGMYRAGGRPIAGDSADTTSAAYVVNLADMRAAPKYLLQALAHHEGLPGHHLQFMLEERRASRQAQATGVSAQALRFQRPRSFGAHAEGWALYAEELPRELGLYDDPWSEVGRLGMEAWRAARLVVDVGIHRDGWTREEAIAFLLASTPLTETQARIEADRYARMPGQATSYMIGKLEIEELRARAESALGARFDLRAFHEEVLGYGSLPLPVLDEVIDRFIAAGRP